MRQVTLLTASLQVQSMVAMRTWWKTERALYAWSSEGEKRRARSGFVRGFGVGAAARIRESRRSIVEAAGTGTDLVLAGRRDRVDAAADAIAGGKARRRRGADALSFSDGHRSGRQANTGGGAITPGRGLAGSGG